MIALYRDLQRIEKGLKELVSDGKLKDFRIHLKTNNRVYIYLIDIIESDLKSIENQFDNSNCVFEIVDEDDDFAQLYYFNKNEKLRYLDTSKNLTHIFDLENKNIITGVPIVTFYSYKGGVGRSTTLASYAAYYAIHQKKRVVVIDCDFEAPGFTNFFMEDVDNPTNNNGVIEYLLDKQTIGETVNIRNYIWQASKMYSGDGEIYVMPAGNLDDSITLEDGRTDRTHYLLGLSRFDFSERDSIKKQFQELLLDLMKEINPDLILFDSRTGFNDVLGLTAFHFSNIIVGFFSNNTQSIPGLHFFIDSIIQRKDLTGVLVNAIVPSSNRRKMVLAFNAIVDSYIGAASDGTDEDLISIDTFTITRNDVLEMIGVKDEDPLNFVDLIENKSFSDYNALFEKLISLTEDIGEIRQEDVVSHTATLQSCVETDASPIMIDDSSSLSLKKLILTRLEEKMPQLYAENVDFEIEYADNRYFYRKCMLDLFNIDKFLVLGNKGTGKTYIYRSLSNHNIVSELKKRANKCHVDYSFVHIVDSDRSFFDTTKFDGYDVNKFSNDKFYERFWLVYIWNVLYNYFKNEPSLKLFNIADDTTTQKCFLDVILDDDKMIHIENDLKALDSLLKDRLNQQAIIIFDELDKVVKPDMWSERISPLINLCKKFRYNRIFPKLFLRSDLFEKISNVNNIQELRNKAIDIEWSQEELFAYFFKIILSHSSKEFCTLMKSYNYYPSKQINKIIKHIEDNKFERQIDIDELKLCCGTFFGKYADTDNTARYGETYDWLFKNLKNANDTISLRPFIDLIKEAMDNAKKVDKSEKPILPQSYFTHGNARGKAVERHFLDLAKERGNEDLEYIIKYVREEADPRFKLLEINREDFLLLLKGIVSKYGDKLTSKSEDQLIYLLKVNGIIRERIVRTGYRNVQLKYQFALLYKYYLGLKNKPNKRAYF